MRPTNLGKNQKNQLDTERHQNVQVTHLERKSNANCSGAAQVGAGAVRVPGNNYIVIGDIVYAAIKIYVVAELIIGGEIQRDPAVGSFKLAARRTYAGLVDIIGTEI